MKNTKEIVQTGIKRFYRPGKQYYARALGIEDNSLMIGIDSPKGGMFGEFQIKWEKMGSEIFPRLAAYDDAWEALFMMPELMKILAENNDINITIDKMQENLINLGYKDITKYKREE